jgi:predicted ATPase
LGAEEVPVTISVAPPGPHLFFSYASGDYDRVAPVAAALAESGLRLWVDRSGIPGGVSYGPEIARAIKSCAALLLRCTSVAFRSRNVRQEIQLAWKYERPILPLRVEAVAIPEDLEYWLEGCQWIDLEGRPVAMWLPVVQRSLGNLGAFGTQTIDDVSAELQRPEVVRLPTPLTGLLGRDREVTEITAHLAVHRLVTLTGPGGVGKTRLAIEIAHSVADSFLYGVDFVDLSAVATPEHVLPAISRVLGVRDVPGMTVADNLAAAIGERRILLVLDNMEQVLEVAPEIATLLGRCPRLVVLGTSRAPLAVRGEHLVPIEPLPVPSSSNTAISNDLASSPAIALFVERAEDVRAGFVLTADNAPTIAAICAQLDGLPLAIELAAARMTLFSPDQLLSRLAQRLTVLNSGPRDLPSRQRTLRDAIAWSHDLLSAEEQTLFRRLAVFQGGCTLDAAESIIGPISEIDVIGGLTSLLEKSLIRQEVGTEAPRFVILETIREYAWEQLVGANEVKALLRQHAEYYLAVVEATGGLLFAGEQKRAKSAAEHGNVQAALRWLVQQG